MKMKLIIQTTRVIIRLDNGGFTVLQNLMSMFCILLKYNGAKFVESYAKAIKRTHDHQKRKKKRHRNLSFNS